MQTDGKTSSILLGSPSPAAPLTILPTTPARGSDDPDLPSEYADGVPIKRMSYSSFMLYQYCAKNWKFKNVDKIEAPWSPAPALGSAVHGAIEDVLKAKCEGTTVRIEDAWRDNWSKVVDNPMIDWEGDPPNVAENKGYQIISLPEVREWVRDFVPMFYEGKPMIERYFRMEVPGVDRPVVGYIDLMHASGIPHDMKTSGRSWTAEKARMEVQPLFYLLALKQMGLGPLNPRNRFTHAVMTTTRNPSFTLFDTDHDDDEIEWLKNELATIWKGIAAGIFPMNTSGWKCSEKFCEFWSRCRGARPSSVSSQGVIGV